MLEFAPGESKTAIAPIKVSPAGLSCEAEIFLGPDEATKVATSGRIPFTSTGYSQNVHLPVAMPAAEGTYYVYIDVYAEGLLIGAYQAVEDVIIEELLEITDPSISRFSISWSETTVLAGSLITAKLVFRSSTSTQYKLEVCLLEAGVVRASGSKMHYVQYTQQSQIAYIDVVVPSEEGVYDTQIRTYRGEVLTGIYPMEAPITVYTVTEPSYLSYQNLTLLYPKYPDPIIWHYLDVECDIVNTANKTITRTVTLWLKEATKLWRPVTSGSYFNAAEVDITLAPGASFHYHFAGQTVGRDPSCIELRDNYGGISERLCGSW